MTSFPSYCKSFPRLNIISLPLFFSYFHGKCSDEIRFFVPPAQTFTTKTQLVVSTRVNQPHSSHILLTVISPPYHSNLYFFFRLLYHTHYLVLLYLEWLFKKKKRDCTGTRPFFQILLTKYAIVGCRLNSPAIVFLKSYTGRSIKFVFTGMG